MAARAGDSLADEAVEQLEQARAIYYGAGFRIAVIGGQQGHAVGGGAFLPTILKLVDEVAKLLRRGTQDDRAAFGHMEIQRAIQNPRDAFGRFRNARDASLGVRGQGVSSHAVNKREHSVHLLADLGGEAFEKRL
jgi:hypothetical protein